MVHAVEERYRQMPFITHSYLIAAVVTTVGCTLDVSAFLPSLSPMIRRCFSLAPVF
jgi:hypothetical protein